MEMKQKNLAVQQTTARKPNLTGIPLQMKTSFEQSSGLSFDDVRVHYDSPQPARLGALAYTQGDQVYIAPGQERHLGHELGHVIQQKQGRVRATAERGGVKLNTSPAMEREADALSRRAAHGAAPVIQCRQAPSAGVVQMVAYPNMAAMWAAVCGAMNVEEMVQQIVARDPVLAELYQDAAQQVTLCDFRKKEGANIQIGLNDDDNTKAVLPFFVNYKDFPDNLQEQYFFIAAIIHELTHAASRVQYHRNVPDNGHEWHAAWFNMNLPRGSGAGGVSAKQDKSFYAQVDLLIHNIEYLISVVRDDTELRTRSPGVYRHLTSNINGRLPYMLAGDPAVHYDTVLGDMMFYLQFNNLQDTRSYELMQRMLREANDRRHQRRFAWNNESPYAFSSWPASLSRY